MAFEQFFLKFQNEIWFLCISDDFRKFSIKIQFGQNVSKWCSSQCRSDGQCPLDTFRRARSDGHVFCSSSIFIGIFPKPNFIKKFDKIIFCPNAPNAISVHNTTTHRKYRNWLCINAIIEFAIKDRQKSSNHMLVPYNGWNSIDHSYVCLQLFYRFETHRKNQLINQYFWFNDHYLID